MSNVISMDGAKLSEDSIEKTVIKLSIPIKASGGWNVITQMNDIPGGVYAFTFSGVYSTANSWQATSRYGGIFYWIPPIQCNSGESSYAKFTYISHATNSQTLNFRIYMPSGSNNSRFEIYTPFTNSVTQTGTLKLRKLL